MVKTHLNLSFSFQNRSVYRRGKHNFDRNASFESVSVLLTYRLTHLCRVDSSTTTLLTGIFPLLELCGQFLLLSCFVKTSEFNANGVDRDQTLRYAASDLGLHFFQCPFYGILGLNG